MHNSKWPRRSKKTEEQLEKDRLAKIQPKDDTQFEFVRVKPKKRKPKHPGYTIIPEHRLWIFEK